MLGSNTDPQALHLPIFHSAALLSEVQSQASSPAHEHRATNVSEISASGRVTNCEEPVFSSFFVLKLLLFSTFKVYTQKIAWVIKQSFYFWKFKQKFKMSIFRIAVCLFLLWRVFMANILLIHLVILPRVLFCSTALKFYEICNILLLIHIIAVWNSMFCYSNDNTKSAPFIGKALFSWAP